jgi:hypothetical protein
VNNPLDGKENDEHALGFALHLSSLFFGLNEFGLSVYGSCFLPRTFVESLPGSPLHFPRFPQNLIYTRSRIHREIASGQIHNLK